MRRGYDASNYLRRIETIKNCKRKLALTSDVIVGFPGETDADFEATLSLVKQCEYDGLYIFKYSPRPGTPAAKLPEEVPAEVIKERFLRLERAQRENQNRLYAAYIGRVVSVLVEGESARSADDLTGHSTCHKVVNFSGPQSYKGEIIDVRITEAKTNSLYGRLNGAGHHVREVV
jgi:tRNA-2-methylthio-N6-dimethylallyladenosine synthase